MLISAGGPNGSPAAFHSGGLRKDAIMADRVRVTLLCRKADAKRFEAEGFDRAEGKVSDGVVCMVDDERVPDLSDLPKDVPFIGQHDSKYEIPPMIFACDGSGADVIEAPSLVDGDQPVVRFDRFGPIPDDVKAACDYWACHLRAEAALGKIVSPGTERVLLPLPAALAALLKWLDDSGESHTKPAGRGTFRTEPVEYSVVKDARLALLTPSPTEHPRYLGDTLFLDPDSGRSIEMCVYKCASGGMFAVDFSHLDQVSEVIPSPFDPTGRTILDCGDHE